MGLSEKDVQEVFDYYQEKRYQDAKDLASSLADKDPNNYHIYYLQAICCIHMLQFDEALMNLGEGAYLYPDYIPSMHALAYLFLKRGDFESAMDKWIAIKTISPKDSLVNQILSRVKSGQLKKDSLNRYAVDDFIQPDLKELRKGLLFTPLTKQHTTLPESLSINQESVVMAPKSKNLSMLKSSPDGPKKKALSSKLTLLLIVLIATGTYVGLRIWWKKAPHSPTNLSLSSEHLVLFSFQPSEIQTKEKALQNLIKKGNYNRIVISMNELIYSNAPKSIKEWIVKQRKSLTRPQDITDTGDALTLDTILKTPHLYQGVFIRVAGTVSNFLRRPQYITFDINPSESLKISNIYFFDTSTETLPFDNQDEVSVFGFFRLDENSTPLIEDSEVSLVKTYSRVS